MQIMRGLFYTMALLFVAAPLLAEERPGPEATGAPTVYETESQAANVAVASSPATQSPVPANTISPLSPNEKFKLAMYNSVLSPVSYGTAAAGAGLSMATRSSLDYGMGARGFARRFGDFMGTTIVYEATGTWMAAALLHQDPRYHRSPQRGPGHRMKYALSRVLVTRGDDGRDQFNAANVIGTAAGAGAATAWHPHQRHRTQRLFTRLGTGLAFDGLEKLAKEFVRFRR